MESAFKELGEKASVLDFHPKSAVVGGGVEDIYGEDTATEDQLVTPWTYSVARSLLFTWLFYNSCLQPKLYFFLFFHQTKSLFFFLDDLFKPVKTLILLIFFKVKLQIFFGGIWISWCSGYSLLRDPQYNKGLAFTEKEREAHYLRGLLPPATCSQQLQVSINLI